MVPGGTKTQDSWAPGKTLGSHAQFPLITGPFVHSAPQSAAGLLTLAQSRALAATGTNKNAAVRPAAASYFLNMVFSPSNREWLVHDDETWVLAEAA